MRAVIGIDRKIKRAWLDALLDHLARTQDQDTLRSYMDEILRGELPGTASRAKSVGIALRIWGGIPADRVPLRDRALEILPSISGGERIWLHWGMMALAYPFFRDLAEIVGRILALQDDITTAQAQERILKSWGDRATTREAAQKLLTTLVDWGVLNPTKAKGHFLPASRLTTASVGLQLWLLEALLKANSSEEIEAQQLLRLPEAFPFRLTVAVSDIRKHDRLSLHRQGLDMDMVALAPAKITPTQKPARKRPRKKVDVGTPSLFDGRQSEEVDHRQAESQAVLCDRPQTDRRPELPIVEPVPVVTTAQGPGVSEAQRIEEPATDGIPTSRPDLLTGAEWAPQGPLSPPIRECIRLYRDGLDYGCIALAYALMESILRLVCRVRLGMRQAKAIDIRNQFAALSAIGVLPVPLKTRLEQSWLERIDYQELSSSEPGDREKLRRIAENHVKLLIEVARRFFDYSADQGRVLPVYPNTGIRK